jgi:hypothetical protein
MKLLSIVSNINGHLIAEQQPQSGGNTIFIILIVATTLYFGYRRAWKFLLIPAVLCLIVMQSMFMGQKTSYRVEVDQPTRQILSQEWSKGKVISSTTIPVSDLNSAEMQFNRGASRIVLIHRDGRQEFPLGEQHLQNEPDQYVVLNAMHEAIGQTPVHP